LSIALLALLTPTAGCGKKDDSDKKKAQGPAERRPPPPPKPLTDKQKVARLVACWRAFEGGDEANLQTCYDKKATSTMVDAVPPMITTGSENIVKAARIYRKAFPGMKYELGLTLLHGNELVTIAANSGVNTGEFMGTPPTQKKVGNYFAQYIKLSPNNAVSVEEIYFAMHQLAAQMGLAGGMPAREPLEPGTFSEHEVVSTQNSDEEKANLELVAAWGEAYNKHDLAAVMERYADDVLFRDNTMPTDLVGKQAVEKGLKDWFAMTSDVKGKALWTWAAGSYVVSAQESTGTWDGPIPGVPQLKPNHKQFKTHALEVVKIEDGKVKEHWLFGNSASFAVQLGLAPDPTKTPPPEKDK